MEVENFFIFFILTLQQYFFYNIFYFNLSFKLFIDLIKKYKFKLIFYKIVMFYIIIKKNSIKNFIVNIIEKIICLIIKKKIIFLMKMMI